MTIPNIAIEFEGHDKCGKDTIAKYVEQLSNYKYTMNVRGILTQLVYNDKFDRDNRYKLTYKPLIILLKANPEDVEIRCRMCHEPKINVEKDIEVFEYYAQQLEYANAAIVYRFNTSLDTPYRIAKEIVNRLEETDIDQFILKEPILLDIPKQYTKEDIKNEDVYYGPLSTYN